MGLAIEYCWFSYLGKLQCQWIHKDSAEQEMIACTNLTHLNQHQLGLANHYYSVSRKSLSTWSPYKPLQACSRVGNAWNLVRPKRYRSCVRRLLPEVSVAADCWTENWHQLQLPAESKAIEIKIHLQQASRYLMASLDVDLGQNSLNNKHLILCVTNTV